MFGVDLGTDDADVWDSCGESFLSPESVDRVQERAKDLGLWGLASKGKIVKSGNSLVVRIPAPLARYLKMKSGQDVLGAPDRAHRLLLELAERLSPSLPPAPPSAVLPRGTRATSRRALWAMVPTADGSPRAGRGLPVASRVGGAARALPDLGVRTRGASFATDSIPPGIASARFFRRSSRASPSVPQAGSSFTRAEYPPASRSRSIQAVNDARETGHRVP